VHILITILHILVCIILIFVVLLQAGKGANMGAAFGGSSQTIFGSSGAGTFLGKMTTVVAAVFMLTSLTLSYFSLAKTSSIMDSVTRTETKKALPGKAALPIGPEKTSGAPAPSLPPGAPK
jgi:preprotein translocase subunit SecG